MLAVPKIADVVPDETFPRELIKIPKNVKLADPQFHVPRPIDLLIGSGATLSMLSVGQIDISQNGCDLILQKTRLGWVIAGGLNNASNKRGVNCTLVNLNSLLERFWRIDDLDANLDVSSDAELCEHHFKQHTTRNNDGRYVVKLPFRDSNIALGDSKSQALRRFYSLQRRLKGDPELEIEYHKVMQEYLELNHMSLVDDEQEGGYYMPHHPVVKGSSITTKVRVVFDASAKTSNNISLNESLLIGPTIQRTLFEHLLGFRMYAYVVTADISRMYRQVLVHPEDRKFQRILWYHNNRIRTFELNTVTFGVSAAPFLAIRTLHQLAEDEKERFPLASHLVKHNFYVDDFLAGANSLREVWQIRDEVIKLLDSGGFLIRKWASNHRHALDNLDEKVFSSDCAVDDSSTLKPLGVVWNAKEDTLTYKTRIIDTSKSFTKRNILSEIAKVFDPLGLLGPVVLFAKVLMQDCWKAKIGWDESVPQELHSRWNLFAKQLPLINDLAIDRRITLNEPTKIEIHGFCDASQKGYGACVYVRSVDSTGTVNVKLLCAKSRVAPVKQITIPKLELCAALTLAKLYKETRSSLTFDVFRCICWSDSTIVLHWLGKSPTSLKTFEANRVTEIQSLGKEIEWRHVRSEDNPADVLSRGQLPSDFIKNRAWFKGPDWLSLPESAWPINIEIVPSELSGFKSNVCLLNTADNTHIFSCSSSYKLLVKAIARILRLFKHKKGSKEPVSVQEKIEAENRILLLIQRERFAPELRRLSTARTPEPNSIDVPNRKTTRFDELHPFIDEHGLIRVGGRIKNSGHPYGRKHPILLPSNHHITDLIIRQTHFEAFHAGIQTTLHLIHNKYWVLNGKDQVRRIVRRCVTCIRERPRPLHGQMADLPACRVNETPAFYHVGVDYFGPIFIKEKKERNRKKVKAYGCIFICMATKAVHLEIVSDLTTEGFLAAFRRFISRRGIPAHVYSDNGTNFVGANSQLKELYILLNSEDHRDTVHDFAVHKEIIWHFNPPLSPHFGGLWEAAVKSFKHHFKRVLKDQLLTFEALNTLSIEIEGILNSRPLCAISSDPNDPLVITPAHILIGRSIASLPNHDLTFIPDNRLSSYQFLTKARQSFWNKWHKEYLNELQKRQKWHNSKGTIDVGSVVILMDSNTPCSRWPLGVVIEVFPGSDGVTRVVSVKTGDGGPKKRNITKLCPLPMD